MPNCQHKVMKVTIPSCLDITTDNPTYNIPKHALALHP
jgi:hypothetical protein